MESRAVEIKLVCLVCLFGAQLTSVSPEEESGPEQGSDLPRVTQPARAGRRGGPGRRVYLPPSLWSTRPPAPCAVIKMLIQNTTAVTYDNRSHLPGFVHLHL